MENRFSTQQRAHLVHRVTSSEVELLIIGGGITGAGILLDAKARGIEACLIEMQDFAAGTSNRSTKLVHGGLRYLKNFQIGLVAEVGKEREIVYHNGPHVTTPLWMLLPIVEGGTFGRFSTSFGLFVYDRLAGVKHHERRKMLTAEETRKIEPLLKSEGLRGAGYYVEYRTDDARLTLEIIKEAVARGATALNYTKAETFIYDEGRVVGVNAKDMHTGEQYAIRAKTVVNATGPWVDELRDIDHSKEGKTLHWTKGVHIVVDGTRLPLRNPVYFDVPDGRMIFAIPRAGKTYIGTTDTNYKSDLLHPRMTVADRDYILAAANSMFPSCALTAEDVESSWAGVRPLIHEEGKSPSEISRKDEVFQSNSGLITIAGGKLTGYRKMAEKVVDIVVSRLKLNSSARYAACTTDRITISGGHLDGGAGDFESYVKRTTAVGVALGLSETEADEIVRRYGTNATTVFSYLEKSPSTGDSAPGEDERLGLSCAVYAMLQYGIDCEMVATPEDFFVRRTGSLYFNIAWVRRWKSEVVQYMAAKLGWSPSVAAEQAERLDQAIEEATVAVA